MKSRKAHKDLLKLLNVIENNVKVINGELKTMLYYNDLLTPESELLAELIKKYEEIRFILMKYMWNGGK